MSRASRAAVGGGWLAANHVAGAAITAAAALLVSRAIGPAEFGVYAFCTAVSGVARVAGRVGVNAWLLARPQEPSEDDYHVALTAMLCTATLAAAAVVLALPWLAAFAKLGAISGPILFVAALLPLHVLSLPASARLERELRYHPVVGLELAAQVLGQAIGIALAFSGWGVWGPLAGTGVRTAFSAIAPWFAVDLRPRLAWQPSRAWTMIRFGFGHVAATGLQQVRSLSILALVGHLLGQDAVGIMGLTLRAVGLIAPVRAAAARIALPALAPIANERARLREAVRAMTETELLLSAPLTVLAVVAYSVIVRALMGEAWQPTTALLPWVAAGGLLSSAHAGSQAALHVHGRFGESSVCSVAGALLLLAAMVILGTRWGLTGCAAASVAAWPASWLQEWRANRLLGVTWSPNAVAWAAGGALAALGLDVGLWLFLPLPAIAWATRRAVVVRATALRGWLRTSLWSPGVGRPRLEREKAVSGGGSRCETEGGGRPPEPCASGAVLSDAAPAGPAE